jgi:hypothetical protein
MRRHARGCHAYNINERRLLLNAVLHTRASRLAGVSILFLD